MLNEHEQNCNCYECFDDSPDNFIIGGIIKAIGGVAKSVEDKQTEKIKSKTADKTNKTIIIVAAIAAAVIIFLFIRKK